MYEGETSKTILDNIFSYTFVTEYEIRLVNECWFLSKWYMYLETELVYLKKKQTYRQSSILILNY